MYELEELDPEVAEQTAVLPRRAFADYEAAVVFILCRRPVPPAPSVVTVEGWTGYLAAHPDDVAYVVDDGGGSRLEHGADEVRPMASASKGLNAVAYARAVALGVLSPDEPVRVGDWERWLVLGHEDAHVEALDHLRILRAGPRAADPAHGHARPGRERHDDL